MSTSPEPTQYQSGVKRHPLTFVLHVGFPLTANPRVTPENNWKWNVRVCSMRMSSATGVEREGAADFCRER